MASLVRVRNATTTVAGIPMYCIPMSFVRIIMLNDDRDGRVGVYIHGVCIYIYGVYTYCINNIRDYFERWDSGAR